MKKIKGKPIGFLLQNPQGFPQNVQQGSFPFGPGPGAATNQVQNPRPSMGFNDYLANAEKFMGVVKQIGPMYNSISPMLQLFRGIGISGTSSVGMKSNIDINGTSELESSKASRRTRARSAKRSSARNLRKKK